MTTSNLPWEQVRQITMIPESLWLGAKRTKLKYNMFSPKLYLVNLYGPCMLMKITSFEHDKQCINKFV